MPLRLKGKAVKKANKISQFSCKAFEEGMIMLKVSVQAIPGNVDEFSKLTAEMPNITVHQG